MVKRLLDLTLVVALLFAVIMAGLGLAVDRDAHAQPSSLRLVTVLASSQRITTTTGSDVVNIGENLNVRGAYLTLDVTGVMTTPVITLTVQAKDPVSSNYEAIFTATSGVTTTGTHTYLIYPGVGSAGGDVVQTLSYPLPAEWRVSVAHSDTDPITYSVGALLVP